MSKTEFNDPKKICWSHHSFDDVIKKEIFIKKGLFFEPI